MHAIGDQNVIQYLSVLVNVLRMFDISGTATTYGTAYVPTSIDLLDRQQAKLLTDSGPLAQQSKPLAQADPLSVGFLPRRAQPQQSRAWAQQNRAFE